jgi:hypothetical protein
MRVMEGETGCFPDEDPEGAVTRRVCDVELWLWFERDGEGRNVVVVALFTLDAPADNGGGAGPCDTASASGTRPRSSSPVTKPNTAAALLFADPPLSTLATLP